MSTLRPPARLPTATVLLALIGLCIACSPAGALRPGTVLAAQATVAHALDRSGEEPSGRAHDEVTEGHKRRRIGDAFVVVAPRTAVDLALATTATALAVPADTVVSAHMPASPRYDAPHDCRARRDLRACRGRAPPAA